MINSIQRPDEANETILVVDDDDAVRAVICSGLAHRGYAVLPARDGADALEVADRHNGPIHLVVSDIVMPGMDGHILFETLRRWYPRLAFLFISGYLQHGVTDEELASTRTAFLPKPFTTETLAHEAAMLLSRSKD